MKKNCNKISNTCTEIVQAPCVDFQGTLGENTNITSPCVNIEDTTEDLYQITDQIIADTSIDTLGNSCLDYSPENVKAVLVKYEEEICELKQQVQTLQESFICDALITNCGLNLSNLQANTDPNCVNPLQTLKDVLQAIIDQLQ